MTRSHERLTRWKAEETAPFSGWDFAYLEGRMFEDEPPWSYETRAGELLQAAQSALDIGTGGGERLLSLRQHWPPFVIATEDYPPNVFLSGQRLAAQGASVVAARTDRGSALPFADAVFDLALNRHSASNVDEIARVLSAAGTYYTQQVHGLWAADLLAAFDAAPTWPDATLERKVNSLQAAGFEIVDAGDWSGRLRFADVGAIVYYLKAIPWLVPDFSVDTHGDALLRLQDRLDRGEPLVFLARKYMVEACKP